MANEQNLIPFSERTPSERSELGRKGAEISNRVQKEKKRMRMILEECMKLKSQNKKYEGLPYEITTALGLLEGAENGNARNYETIVTMLGETPNLIQEEEKETPSIEINVVDNSDLEKIMYDKRKE